MACSRGREYCHGDLQGLSCLCPSVSDSMQFGILNIIWYRDALALGFRNIRYGEILVLGFSSFR